MIYVLDPATRAVHARSRCEVEGLCFLITVTSIHTGKQDRMAIVRCAYELKYYLDFATDVAVDGVQMLCPPSVTGRDVWSLEELVEIVCFRGTGADQSTVVYETAVGTYKFGDLDLRRKKTRHVWFSQERLQGHTPRVSNRVLDERKPHLYAGLV